MNTRYSFRRACTLVAVVAITATTAHADAAESTMSIDARAPLAATLLPTVSVIADAVRPDALAQWRVADEAPLRVTLMPTVRVSAEAESLAFTQLPTVRVTATPREIEAATRTAVAATRNVGAEAFAVRTLRVAATERADAADADGDVPLGLVVEPR
ncbi:MAG: hypothetical protein J0L88_09725 [Xanthomonadales bacterium]|nr:hypothetical protein [Xanthomonadales bacterium]